MSWQREYVRDPGNLGTIIRLCDWFGVENIFASPDTVDAYNPKTVQATMGAILRRKVYIPPFPPDSCTSESLNVAISTAILCYEIRRP